MNERVVVDPITRIEGHLRIEAEMDGQNISKAYSSGTMVRGIETILRGRDPRDAWAYAQRICGVCTLVHGMASVRSVEDALKVEIPANAQLIRNLMIGAQYIHDHVMHFYHLHALDWVDVVSALSADPAATATLAQNISAKNAADLGAGNWAKSSPGYFSDVQKRLKTFVEGGQLGIFANGYWGHPAYKLPPEANLMAVAHYLEALAWQREAAKLHAIFGGKNPHPNFVVGGVASPIDLNSDSAINSKKLAQVQDLITLMRQFVGQVYVPDTIAIASFYKDWSTRGEGLGNFLCYGDLPEGSINDVDSFLFPRGAILNRDLSKIEPVDLYADGEIQEFISHSWYDYSDGKDAGLHPYKGETELNYDDRGGPAPPYQQLNVDDGYSWLKSPRWNSHSVEVGPLARMLLLYASPEARAHEQAKTLVDYTLGQLELPVDRPVLDPRAHRGAHAGVADRRRRHAGLVRPTGAEHPRRRHQDLQRDPVGSVELAEQGPGRRLSWRPHAARSATGSSSRTARSPTTRPWCPAPGTPVLATPKASPAPTRPRWPTTPSCTTRSSPSRSCAPSTPSTPASPARCICRTRKRARRSRSR